MIFLCELCLFLQFCAFVNADVSTVASWFKSGGMTGHSQGVVCAVVVALSKSTEHFVETTLKFLVYMFFHGVRVQQAYPTKTLPAKGHNNNMHTYKSAGRHKWGSQHSCVHLSRISPVMTHCCSPTPV